MLELKDFYILPELDVLMRELVAETTGMVVVAGLDARPNADDVAGGFLPSGRPTIFRILVREMMERFSPRRVAVVAERRDAVRLPRGVGRKINVLQVRAPETYKELIDRACLDRPKLLVVEHINDAETAQAALVAAGAKIPLLSQMDTIFRGPMVVQALQEMGVPDELVQHLQWVIGVQRFATLCAHCKHQTPVREAQLAALQQRYPEWSVHSNATFYMSSGCAQCEYSGRQGNVMAFDVFRATQSRSGMASHVSRLSLEAYLFRLAAEGQLALDDVLGLESDQLRRTYHLLASNEQALHRANQSLRQKVAELEAAYQVLQHRTEALISLQEMGQALTIGHDLHDVALRVCRYTAQLCGADRAVLYYLQDETMAEVLASHGWDPARVPAHVPVSALDLPTTPLTASGAIPFDEWPPGIPARAADVEGVYLYAGLHVPLVAQNKMVGLLVAHATQKKRFEPGDVALLHSFANQAALALQRAGLIEELRAKIAALEAAQAGLAQKERMEHELALAREVQQSVLPRVVPHIPGYRFAMHNEPARQVGGDFYDVVGLDDDTFAITIADVSDKGMPAALYMALSRSLILCEARLARTPYEVLCSVNELLLELGEPNMFVTVFYALIERASRRMRYVRAGHDWPLLFRGGVVRELPGEGMALGLLPTREMHMEEETVMLEAGDRLVLYTDGFPEAMSPAGAFYGRQSFIRLLQEHAALPPDELCVATFTALKAFRAEAPQHDDMTMLVMDVG